jgi:uncharacterized protein
LFNYCDHAYTKSIRVLSLVFLKNPCSIRVPPVAKTIAMSRLFAIFALCVATLSSFADQPLRIFIRAGQKTHGPRQHDAPQFLKDWKPLLESRGAKVDGALNFPTTAQLDATDVLIIYCQNGGSIHGEDRANLEKFLNRGGGIVVLHDGVTGDDSQWFKTIIGGAWEYGHAKFFEGKLSFYYQDHNHPVTRGASNFDLVDEMYWNLHMQPDAHILAATYAPDARNKHGNKPFPSIYNIVPQMWTYETNNHRAFVSLLGHEYRTFSLPHYRAVLMRAIAWAGKRDIDSLTTQEELATLRYPEGGPTAPDQAAKSFIVHPDFQINLVASEPLIEKPISMDWDPQGRLWVAETPEYPIGRNGANRAAHDRISILEDTNHDGLMDKKSVFADNLELITSFLFYKDGVIVAQAPDVFWLRDTNHDGVAETKVPLYTGFGTFDRHAVISNMRWSMDGWIYATLGYSRGRVKSADGKKDFGDLMSGVIRFKPDGSDMQQVASKNGNTWGVDIAPNGELFFTQANGAHINHVVVPEYDLARGKVGNTTSFKQIEDHDRVFPARTYDQQAYQQIDFVGGFTGAAGCCIYNGGAWPEKYNYTHFVCEPTVNIVHQDFLKTNEVTFTATKERNEEFLASTDLWFRPIHARIGPDGALYILDFYNQAIVHNDPRGPRHGPANAAIRPDRDHQFGRIWRVQNKEAHPAPVPKFDLAHPLELVQALKHPNDWVRATAQRLLTEQPATREIIEPLVNISVSGSPESRVRALWTAHQLHLLSDTIVLVAMTDDDHTAAKTGLKIAAERPTMILALRDFLHGINATDPHLTLAALLATSHHNVNINIAADLARIYPQLSDPWTQSAGVEVSSKNPMPFLTAAFEAPEPEPLTNWVALVSAQVASKQDAKLAAEAIQRAASANERLAATCLREFARILKPDVTPTFTTELQHALETLLNSANTDAAVAALPFVTRWDKTGTMKTSALQNHLIETIRDATQSDDKRTQAITTLLSVAANETTLTNIAAVLATNTSVALQKHTVQSLGTITNAAAILISAYPRVQAEVRSEVFAQLIKRADWTVQFINALETGTINQTLLDPNSVYLLRKHANPEVAKRANAFLDKARGPLAKEKDALIAKFAPEITKPGDTAAGHAAFTKNCAICHNLNGEGKDIGPNLTGIGAHGREELLVHVLDPNRVVEPNFNVVSIETKDGEELEGIVARENEKSIVLRNQTSEHEIARADIKQKRNTDRSLMPEGFEALGPETLRNILSYICDPKTVATKK